MAVYLGSQKGKFYSINKIDGPTSTARQILQKTISGVYSNSRITTIGNYAFAYCSSLLEVDIPNVSIIGGSAFYYCQNLIAVNVSLLTEVKQSTFYACWSLNSINLSKVVSIASDAFYNCVRLTSINLPSCTYIGFSAFTYCGFTELNLSRVNSLMSYCFYSCSQLSVVSLSQIKSIQYEAFCRCYNLISFNLTQVSMVPSLSTYVFSSTPIGGYSKSAGQYGSIYVPASLYNSFLTAKNWSSVSSRIISV